MPYKRKFTKKARSWKGKRNFVKKGVKGFNRIAADPFNKAASTAPASALTYRRSLYTNQPFPDKFRTWFDVTQQGVVSSGASAYTFEFALNQVVLPFSYGGGLAQQFPNPVVSNTVKSPAGVKNILFNTNATGVYNLFRVWRVVISMTVIPLNHLDGCNISLSPVIGTSYYSNFTTASAGPNSCSGSTIQFTGEDGSISANWSIPALLGAKDVEYASLTNGFNYTTTPTVFCQVFVVSNQQVDFTDNIPITIRAKYFVEMFNRTDAALLD